MFSIFFDSMQEGDWFQNLHPALESAVLEPFPVYNTLKTKGELFQEVLSFDRPDIVLCEDDIPILVVERTSEVPSGHNVGQRFARLVAAVKSGIPTVYFGPYAAYKHGGLTQGPRYMNLRLFYALKNMSKIYNTPVSIINWIVDQDYEIIRSDKKDIRIKEYLYLFFDLYMSVNFNELKRKILISDFEEEQASERKKFVSNEIRNPEQYDIPPDSVEIIKPHVLNADLASMLGNNFHERETVIYNIGMKYIRSDPYTGTALMYVYLYCGSLEKKLRNMVLNFPNISIEMWREASLGLSRKDVRLYKIVADAIIFEDGVLSKELL